MKKINFKGINRELKISIGLALAILVITILFRLDYLAVLKGLIGIPLATILPGWIWTEIFFAKGKGIIEKLAMSWMLSIVLVGWTVYGLRYFFFEKITNVLIIDALILVVGLGWIIKFIKKGNER